MTKYAYLLTSFLNLDLGIEVYFYNGMDDYANTARTVSVSNSFSISSLHVYKSSLQKLRNLKYSKLQTLCTQPQIVIELKNLCTGGFQM